MKEGSWRQQNNFAFIDAQNLHQGIKELGWQLSYHKFRRYLAEKYDVQRALLFIGFIPQRATYYNKLRAAGFELMFKNILLVNNRPLKGNCDAELVFHLMRLFNQYEQAVLISGDGVLNVSCGF